MPLTKNIYNPGQLLLFKLVIILGAQSHYIYIFIPTYQLNK